MILDLGLKVENSQRPRWREPQKWPASCQVHEHADQEIALAYLGSAAHNEHAAGSQNARCDDIVGHRPAIIEQRAER